MSDPNVSEGAKARRWFRADSGWAGLAVAVAAAGLALLGQLFLQVHLGRGVFLLFWPAVLGVATYAGLAPALLTSVLSVIAVDHWLVETPRAMSLTEMSDVVPLGIFALASGVVSTLARRRDAAELRARAAVNESEEYATQLAQQAIELESQLEESQAMSEELAQTSNELQERTEQAEAAELFSRAILESIADPFVVEDADWRFRYINGTAARAITRAGRFEPHELTGRVVWEAYPELVGTELEAQMRRAADTRTPVQFESFSAETGLWWQVSCYPLADGGLATQWRDITARKKAAEAMYYLDRASTLLSSPLDPERRLQDLAHLVVPDLADWCGIDIVGDDRTTRQLAVAHADPAKVEWARELSRRYPPNPDATSGVPNVLRTGKPELYAEIPPEMLEATAVDAEHLRLIRELGLRSAMVVPLAARGEVFGALTMVTAESRRRYTPEDLALANELAHRAAFAIDNARLFAQEAEARTRADDANRAKSEFLATMSHELRTPLNAIAGYAELLEIGVHGPLAPAQQDAVLRIQRSQRHLLGLINDVLNFARIDAGHVELELEDVPVHETLSALETLIAPQVHGKRITYVYEPCDPGVHARADLEKVRQILINLLSNAIKFTAAGGRVQLWCEATDGVVRIAVADTGHGIPADKTERIFEPFVQLDASSTRRHEGTGLGLAISRDLARAMSGEIVVDSEVGRGSTFRLVLPRARTPGAPK